MEKPMRILQIDLARQKENLDVIKNLFDIAKKFKYTSVFLYLEDRIKTESYPYASDEESYSADEVRKMVAYATKLGLDLIPVVNNLSHTERFLAHKELSHLAELRGNIKGRFFEAGEANYISVCPSLPETYEFFDKYYEEVAALFPSKYFYPGLDEYFDIGFCEKCRKRFEEDGGIGQIFLDHIIHTNNLLTSLGKNMIMADDMLYFCPEILPQIPRNIVFRSWCYEFIDRTPMAQFRNNRRIDLFHRYDKLGFKYIPVVWTIFDFNVDSYTSYFKQYSPIGYAATVWQMSADNIINFVPHIAYTGLLWDGVLENEPYERMKLAIKETVDVTDSEAAILALASFSAPLNKAPRQYYFADDVIVRKNINFDDWHKQNMFLYDALKPMKDKNIFTKNTYMGIELAVLLYKIFLLAQRLFDFRSGVKQDDCQQIKKSLLDIRETLSEHYDEKLKQWKLNRSGLSSKRIENEFSVMLSDIDRLLFLCESSSFGECGCVDLTILMPDKSIRVTTEISVKYKNGEVKTVCKDVYKPLVTSNYNIMEKGPFLFNLSAIVENPQDIEEITISHNGFGEVCETYACVRYGKNTLIPAEILNTFGSCTSPENILINDNRAATFGGGDMNLCFENPEEADKKHGITLKLTLQ